MRKWSLAAAFVVLLVVVVGPATYSLLAGRPLILDCKTLTSETCDRAIDEWTGRSDSLGDSGPVVLFVVDFAHDPESTCADVTITRWFLFSIGREFAPLC